MSARSAGDARTRAAMRWRSAAVIGGAAVAVLLVAGLLTALQAHGGGRAAGVADASDLPAPAAGQRWVSWHGVAVEVPGSWRYGHELDDQWCADDGSPTPPDLTPYVSLDPAAGFHSQVGCFTPETHDPVFGPAPESLWAEHVTLEPPHDRDSTWHDGPWTLTTRTVDHVEVKVLSRDPTQGTALLDTVRTVTVDDAGCDVSSPIQDLARLRPEPFDVTSVDGVDAVSVCQYDRAVPVGSPGLIGSHLMTGSMATDYLRALEGAPTGGGPDDPENCAAGPDVEGTGIVVRLWSGATSRDMFAYYDSCRGNGVDDGTNRRRLTHGTCAPLFAAPPVTPWGFQQDLFAACTEP